MSASAKDENNSRFLAGARNDAGLAALRKCLDAPDYLVYDVVEMPDELYLGEFEQIVLLAILRLSDNAYGVTIREEIGTCTGRAPSPGALYTTLDRLEEKGLLSSRTGDPTPQRGGRAKRFFTVSATGVKAVAQAQRRYQKLLEGFPLPGVACA